MIFMLNLAQLAEEVFKLIEQHMKKADAGLIKPKL